LNEMLKEAPSAASQWQAFLQLILREKNGGSILARCRHEGPLYVQKPFYPEGRETAHVYILHPPGGIVSGDELNIDIQLEDKAQALFTTPGAGRVYRARHDKQAQCVTITLNAAENAQLEWLPLENIFYPGAHTRMNTRIRLHKTSRFIGWDVSSFGLPAQGEKFNKGQISQRLEIWRDDKPCLIEHLLSNPENDNLLSAKSGMQNLPINGIFVAGPFDDEKQAEALITQLRELPLTPLETDTPARVLLGISYVNQFIVARFLGECSQYAKHVFTQYWQTLRPELLSRPACLPRIWAT